MEEEAHLFAGDDIPKNSKKKNYVSEKRDKTAVLCFLVVILIVAVVVLFAAAAALGVLYGRSVASSNSSGGGGGGGGGGSTNTSVCMTESCVSLASSISYNLNPSIDPCKDFYNYSCGGWAEKSVIPPGNGLWGLFEELDERNKIGLKKLLEGDEESKNKAIETTRKLYQSCMDLDQITKTGSGPLADLLMSVGGWELVKLHNDSASWSLNNTDFRHSKMLGNSAFFTLDISVNDKNSSEYVVELSQSGLSLPSATSYNSSSLTEALSTYITAILKLLSNNTLSDSDATSAAEGILDIEKKLAKIFVSNVKLRDPYASYNPIKLKDLSNGTFFKQFNWTLHIVNAFKSVDKKVTDSLIVIVRTPSYFKNLSDVFEKFDSDAVENYFKWKLVSQYVRFLGSDFLSVYYDYTSAVTGSGEIERYKTCISDVESLAPNPVARLYTDYILPKGTNTTVKAMVSEIKNAFEERLKDKDWLDSETIHRSVWKVGNISEMIAFPQSIYNDTALQQDVEALDAGRSNYFNTAVQSVLLGNRRDLQRLGKPVDKTEWELPPTVVNAYYEPLYNEFVFLEGILRPPFLDQGWPEYFNYGAFGVVIGHELTHGFDDQGQQYNQYGVLTPWWTKESTEAFDKRKECFVKQYSEYSVFGHHINGDLTLGENIADNGGIHTAYQAYKNVLKSSSKEPQMLPSIDLTPDQLYFVSFAQLWCSLFTPEFIATNLEVNPHSPGPYRVIGSVSNSKDFAEAFKCSSKAPMNPSDKCDLW